MRIKPSTRVHAMLRVHPQLEEVLEDHDLDPDEISQMSIRQACAEHGLDAEEVLEDLKASLRDSPTEGWLDVGGDEDDSDDSDDYESEEEDDYYEDDGDILDVDDGDGDDDGEEEWE